MGHSRASMRPRNIAVDGLQSSIFFAWYLVDPCCLVNSHCYRCFALPCHAGGNGGEAWHCEQIVISRPQTNAGYDETLSNCCLTLVTSIIITVSAEPFCTFMIFLAPPGLLRPTGFNAWFSLHGSLWLPGAVVCVLISNRRL